MKFTHTTRSLKGELTVPGDKSISHRAVMLGSLAEGTTEITHFLRGADCLSTIDCFRKMGVEIQEFPERILVHGKGLHGLHAPASILNCGNSGTTTRLLAGILAGQTFSSEITGDASIQKRPMERIIKPLLQLGASVKSLKNNGCVPLKIQGHPLKGIHYHSPVASAQVKSCILLAGLYSDDITSVTEPSLSRNHTELMLSYFGARVRAEGTTSSIAPGSSLYGASVKVPGDISSAAYFLVAALMVPGSEVLLRNVGINPTRNGILRVIRARVGEVKILNKIIVGGEPTADLLVHSSHLHGTVIEGTLIPSLIDEIPILAVLATVAEGTTVIRNADELKVKESNRLNLIVDNLSRMGADIESTEDGMIIHGGRTLRGTVIDSHLDHRIAMSFAVASLIADGETEITNAECVNISYPAFYEDLFRLI